MFIFKLIEKRVMSFLFRFVGLFKRLFHEKIKLNLVNNNKFTPINQFIFILM